MSLATFPNTASVEEVTAAMDRDGGAIIENYVSDEVLEALRADLLPAFHSVGTSQVEFLGGQTRRLGCLFQYSKHVAALVEQQHFLGAAEHFLRTPSQTRHGSHVFEQVPDYHLSLTQGIAIQPGEGSQPLHRDDMLMYNPHPGHQVRVQLMVALSDFTADNGGTNIIAGSHHWGIDRAPTLEEAVPTEMKAGSGVMWLGGVYHGGGLNRTEDDTRYGVTIAMDRAHLKQEENHFVVYTREIIDELPPLTRKLLEYDDLLGNWGYVLIDGEMSSVGDYLKHDLASPRIPAG